jgi:hypothetical protein
MKAKLIFNLPEDQYEFKHACNGTKYISALEDIANMIRSKLKYGNLNEAEDAAYSKLSEEFYDIIKANGIELFKD